MQSTTSESSRNSARTTPVSPKDRQGPVGLLALLAAFILILPLTPARAQTVPLGTAADFGVLGASAVTNTGATVISADLGISPNGASSVTGFPPGIVAGSTHFADAVALNAQNDVTTAYNTLAGRACDVTIAGDLGGLTLIPGVYCSAGSMGLTGALTLDAQGDPDAVFIFQMGTTLTTASNASVDIINGGQSCNLFWQVGSSATIGTATQFLGNILALVSITFNTGANSTGRVLARTGAVTLDGNAISACAIGAPPGGPPGGPGTQPAAQRIPALSMSTLLLLSFAVILIGVVGVRRPTQ